MTSVIIITVAVIAVALLVSTVVGAYVLYSFSVRRRKKDTISVWEKPFPDTPSRAEIKFGHRLTEGRRWMYSAARRPDAERISIMSHDGLRLFARLIPCEEHISERGVLLMMHGYRSDPIHEFGSCAETFSKMGFVLCLPSQRAHGDSEGKHLSYGINERFDVAAWARFLAERYPDRPIILFGVSMGASSVLMASELELPKNVVGVVADCGFTSPEEITKKVLRRDMKIPLFPLYRTAELFVCAFAGYRFSDVSALDAVSNTDLQIMIVHGTEDAFVPYEMGQRLYKAVKSPCLFLSGEGAQHGETFLMHGAEYVKMFDDFLRLCGIE